MFSISEALIKLDIKVLRFDVRINKQNNSET